MKLLWLSFLMSFVACTSAAAAALPSTSAGEPTGPTLIFYAQSPKDDLWPLLFQTLQTDLAAEKGDLASPPSLVIGSDVLRGVSYPSILSVKLLGRCDLRPGLNPSTAGPLGWVKRVSGDIQPYIFIDCDRLSQFLRPVAAGTNSSCRKQMMAQAIAHVLLHEWNHVATQSSAHDKHGLYQAYLSVNDLIGSPRNKALTASTR